MYRPPAFAVDDADADADTLDAFIDAHPFAILASSGTGAPQLSHAPVLRAANGDLVCHLARPNPHGAVLAGGAATTVIFSGPHGYVSPRWYAVDHAVPTWNYTSVHVQVTPVEIKGAELLRSSMEAMLDRFEPAPDIRDIVTDDTVSGMLRGIRGFRLEVVAREGAFKLSQNRSETDQLGVLAGLASGSSGDAALAEFMSARRGLLHDR